MWQIFNWLHFIISAAFGAFVLHIHARVKVFLINSILQKEFFLLKPLLPYNKEHMCSPEHLGALLLWTIPLSSQCPSSVEPSCPPPTRTPEVHAASWLLDWKLSQGNWSVSSCKWLQGLKKLEGTLCNFSWQWDREDVCKLGVSHSFSSGATSKGWM